MLPDRSCYEERYRLTARTLLGLVAGLVSASVGIMWHPAGLWAGSIILVLPAAFAAAAVALAMPAVISVACGRIAFRADAIGITLGVVPDSVPAVRRPAEFVPWADVERIVLHLARPGARGSHAQVENIAVQRRAGAVPVPPPGLRTRSRVFRLAPVAKETRLSRRVTGWQLDRDRLAAVAAALAPGIPIIEADTDA
jgi:hypothetical protein